MPTTLTITDETPAGKKTGELTLDFLTEQVTVRELIRSRIYQEVKDYNVKRVRTFNDLVQPTDTERALRETRSRRPRQIDWQKQLDVALEAFSTNGFLVLVDDRQVEDLDESVELRADTKVSFVKLVPLVGG